MSFANGDRAASSRSSAASARSNTGTTLRFWPDPKYFDTPEVLAAAAEAPAAREGRALPRPDVRLTDESRREGASGITRTACATTCARSARRAATGCRPNCSSASSSGKREAVDWALAWLPRRRRARAGKLRQPDPDGAGRHARQRPALRPHRRAARVLRLPQPAAARRQARARGRVGSRELRAVAEDDRPAVLRPDQGAPVFARGGGLRRGRAQIRFSLWLNQHVEDAARRSRSSRSRRAARA